MSATEYHSSALATDSIFNAVFPVKAYYSGILQYYPIILKDIDTTDENAMGKLWLYSIPFADADFDYLVIAFSEKESFVNRMCLQFPVRMLKEIKQAIEDEDSERLESVSYPYPVDATETMLECFDHIYRILPLPQTDPQATTVGDIAEELWIYSKLNTFLLENDDKEYCKDQQMIIWDSIKKHQKQLLNVLTHEKSAALDSIIKGVHKGETFDNPELNNFVTDFSIETA